MAYDIHLAPGAAERAATLLRRPVNWELLAAACGALDGSRVEFSLYRDWLWADVRQPDILEQHCTLRRDRNGRLYIYIHEFTKRASARKGIGGDSVELQVKAAKALGCEYVEMWAAGDATSASRNGYYTWAVLGFDAPISLLERHNLPRAWQHATTVSAVILLGGKDWWRKYGGERKMIFDLRPGSLSYQVMDARRSARERKD
jgi:hypothetical protein